MEGGKGCSVLTLLLICSAKYCAGKRCVDDVKGVCNANDLFGWCFYSQSSGVLNCDEEKFCAKQAQIRTKLSAYGCFNRSETEVNCCCNEASMCNYQFIEDSKGANEEHETSVHSQTCSFLYTVEKTEYHFNSCRDPWCFSLLIQNISSEGLGREESSLKGCQSWILHRILDAKERPQLSAKLPYIETMKIFLEKPRCSEIVGSKVTTMNETRQACVDFYFKVANSDLSNILLGGFQ
ncbi:unnamed protein product [Enterobius vermicularis]|uniref:Activin_recp domain-containing protein n=1 Tax=Enterobius vermicularis TaxID=51028 RepID=A0A0N4UWX0_ENTVE|nr:unnamed protein product [Enterobius vermicularis]